MRTHRTATALSGIPAAAVLFLLLAAAPAPTAAQDPGQADILRAAERVEAELVARHGESIRPRLQRGVAQVSALWRAEDGDAAAFADFVRTHFAADPRQHDAMFHRFEATFEQLEGLMLESARQLRMHVDVEQGEILPFDRLLAAWDPRAHLDDDLFASGVAFVVLLNFPLTTLEERLAGAATWSRRQWAEARLAQRFARRVPAEVNLANARARAEADAYISGYNIWMHHLVDDSGSRLFPAGMRLISHWNLRDEIKAAYGTPDALARQRTVQQVMERIVTQTIPAAVIDDPRVDWNPFSNTVTPATVVDYDTAAFGPPAAAPDPAREDDVRYATLLATFRAARLVDPFSPSAPTAIARAFERREISEERVRSIFESVLASPLVARTARIIGQRLDRELEPFDIWYDGFKARGAFSQQELDAIAAQRYPDAQAFRDDIPRILLDLGFPSGTATFVASHIDVHPSRGAGHAWGAGRRGDPAFLRTRVETSGMDYKGYNIAVHELGHNVEQVLSLNRIDHTLLAGVPNNAFTEALAFVFQERDLQLLGLDRPDPQADALRALDSFWNTFEIAGVSLVDIDVWHWMYENPDATPAQLRDAVVRIAQDVWNRYYAPVFGQRDSPLLGVYSHMISYPLYLADYPLGLMIAFQIKDQMERASSVGPEFIRMVAAGRVVPDLWMQQAAGAPVGADALLAAAATALDRLESASP
jgi:hypothetical protein